MGTACLRLYLRRKEISCFEGGWGVGGAILIFMFYGYSLKQDPTIACRQMFAKLNIQISIIQNTNTEA